MTTNDPADVLAMREALLADLMCDPQTNRLTTLLGHDSMRERLDDLIALAAGEQSAVVEAARLVSQWADAVDPMPDELRAELRDLRRYFEEETTPALTARCGYVYPDASLCDEPDHAPLVSHDFQPTPALTAARLAALEGALRAIVSELERFWEHGEECPVWATDDVTDEPMSPGDIPARHEACDCGIAVLLGKADAALATLPAPAAEVEG